MTENIQQITYPTLLNNLFKLDSERTKTNHSQFFNHSHFILINFDRTCGDYLILSPKKITCI